MLFHTTDDLGFSQTGVKRWRLDWGRLVFALVVLGLFYAASYWVGQQGQEELSKLMFYIFNLSVGVVAGEVFGEGLALKAITKPGDEETEPKEVK